MALQHVDLDTLRQWQDEPLRNRSLLELLQAISTLLARSEDMAEARLMLRQAEKAHAAGAAAPEPESGSTLPRTFGSPPDALTT